MPPPYSAKKHAKAIRRAAQEHADAIRSAAVLAAEDHAEALHRAAEDHANALRSAASIEGFYPEPIVEDDADKALYRLRALLEAANDCALHYLFKLRDAPEPDIDAIVLIESIASHTQDDMIRLEVRLGAIREMRERLREVWREIEGDD